MLNILLRQEISKLESQASMAVRIIDTAKNCQSVISHTTLHVNPMLRQIVKNVGGRRLELDIERAMERLVTRRLATLTDENRVSLLRDFQCLRGNFPSLFVMATRRLNEK